MWIQNYKKWHVQPIEAVEVVTLVMETVEDLVEAAAAITSKIEAPIIALHTPEAILFH